MRKEKRYMVQSLCFRGWSFNPCWIFCLLHRNHRQSTWHERGKQPDAQVIWLWHAVRTCSSCTAIQTHPCKYRVKQKYARSPGAPTQWSNCNHKLPTDQVEIPLLSAYQMKMAGDAYPVGEVGAGEEADEDFFGQFSFCDELLNRMYKFMEVVQTTFQQLHIQGIFSIINSKQVTVTTSVVSPLLHNWEKGTNFLWLKYQYASKYCVIYCQREIRNIVKC